MGREAHVMALRAAAKVAFAMGISGCGGEAESSAPAEGAKGGGAPGGEDQATNNAPEEGAGTAESAYGAYRARRPRPGTGPRFVCEGPRLCYQTQEQCCRGVVQHAIPDGGNFWDPDMPKPSSDVSRCCEILLKNSDDRIANGDFDTERMPWDMVSFCCSVTPRTGPTCTPWGPPMPPAMPFSMTLGVRWGAKEGALA
jgi:hypothetical protein